MEVKTPLVKFCCGLFLPTTHPPLIFRQRNRLAFSLTDNRFVIDGTLSMFFRLSPGGSRRLGCRSRYLGQGRNLSLIHISEPTRR